jgi:hypothetical protein
LKSSFQFYSEDSDSQRSRFYWLYFGTAIRTICDLSTAPCTLSSCFALFWNRWCDRVALAAGFRRRKTTDWQIENKEDVWESHLIKETDRYEYTNIYIDLSLLIKRWQLVPQSSQLMEMGDHADPLFNWTYKRCIYMIENSYSLFDCNKFLLKQIQTLSDTSKNTSKMSAFRRVKNVNKLGDSVIFIAPDDLFPPRDSTIIYVMFIPSRPLLSNDKTLNRTTNLSIKQWIHRSIHQ